MATNPIQTSESTKDCLAKIDKIIENALGSDNSGVDFRTRSSALGETKGMGSYMSSASPDRKATRDVSNIIFSPARDNYSSTKSSIDLPGLGTGETPVKRYEFEDELSSKDSTSYKESRSRISTSSDVSDNWVNYQFDRLVADKKNVPRVTTTNEVSNDTHRVTKVKNVEDILREYSDNSSISIATPTAKPSYVASLGNNLYRTGLMNRSHNNETLNSTNTQIDKMRRVGSSVDGDVGDVLKSFGAKCSLSGTRCSSSQMSTGEETKSFGIHRDSEVDFKPMPNSSGRVELGDIRTDLSDLNTSFQKERERLRQLENLIRKSPLTSSSSGPEVVHSLRSHNYSSRFLNEYSGRKAYSSMDYSKYSSSDWMSSSPVADYLGRASSSMSYKNLGIYSPTTRAKNYMLEYNPKQYSSPGFDTARVPSMSSQKYDVLDSDADPMSHSSYLNSYPKPSDSANLSKTKLNRSYNAKKDRNMSKSQTETQNSRRKSSSVIKTSKRPSKLDTSLFSEPKDSLQDNFYYNSKAENKSRNKNVTPNSSYTSDIFQGYTKKSTRSNYKSNGKFQPYRPFVGQNSNIFPNTSKSEISTLDTNRLYRVNENEFSDIEYYPHKNRWTSALISSTFAPAPEAGQKSESCENQNNEYEKSHETQLTEPRKRRKNRLRSRSECRVPNKNVSSWSVQRDQFASGNKTSISQNNGHSRVKSSNRKLKPKLKKGASADKKQKNKTKKGK